METWLCESLKLDIFLIILRPFFNLLVAIGEKQTYQYIILPCIKFLQDEKLCADPECRRLLKTIFDKLTQLKLLNFREIWAKFLQTNQLVISNTYAN